MHKEPYGLMPIFAHRCMHHEIYGKRLQYETYKSSQIMHSINDTIDVPFPYNIRHALSQHQS